MSDSFAPPDGPEPDPQPTAVAPSERSPSEQSPTVVAPAVPPFGQSLAYPYQGGPAGDGSSGYLMPPQPKSNRIRNGVISIAVVAVAAVGLYAINAHSVSSTPDAQPTLNLQQLLPPDVPTVIPTTPAPQPTAMTDTASCVPSITACLMSAPKGSSSVGDSWGEEPAIVSDSTYVDHFYTDSSDRAIMEARLSRTGISQIAKKSWNLGSVQSDDVLLSFGTSNAATAWYDSDTFGQSGTKIVIPGGGGEVTGFDTAANSHGVAWTVVYGVSGSTAMELWVEKSDRNDSSDATQWASAQMQDVVAQSSSRTVPTAPTAGAAAYTGVGNGSASCASGSIDECLVPAPSGSRAWRNGSYATETDVTITQYVDNRWSPADQADMIQTLETAGVYQIAHRDWVTSDDLQADVTVLQYGSSALASTQDQVYQATFAAGTTFTIANCDAVGTIHAMGDDGNVDVEISGDSGPYQVVIHFLAPATADFDDAAQLFNTEFALLPTS